MRGLVASAQREWRGFGAIAQRLGGWFVAACVLVLACMAVVCGPSIALASQAPVSGEVAEVEDAPSNLIDVNQRPDSSAIYDTLISDLAQADSYYNGQTVQVTGEAVGDRINATLSGDYHWITLQATDRSYAQVTVYMSEESSSAIDTFGMYGKTGSEVQVRGVFNLACDEHEGLSDLHAEYVSVVKRGSEAPDEFELNRFLPGFVLCVVAALLGVAYYWLRERRR